MRLKAEILEFIKTNTLKFFPGSDVYLFGSRTNDNLKGGDIDLMILSDEKLANSQLRAFRVQFYKKFGWQKIDLVNFQRDEQTTFRQIIEPTAIAL